MNKGVTEKTCQNFTSFNLSIVIILQIFLFSTFLKQPHFNCIGEIYIHICICSV